MWVAERSARQKNGVVQTGLSGGVGVVADAIPR